MKRLLWILAISFAVSAQGAFADSISLLNVNISYVTVSMRPNNGSGDNATVTLIGPGTKIVADGGMACFEWCSGVIPDLNSVSLSQLFVGPYDSVTLFGKSYDPNEFGLFCCVFSGADLNGSVRGQVGSGDTFAEVLLNLPCCGNWNLNFEPVDGGFEFVHGTFWDNACPRPRTRRTRASGDRTCRGLWVSS